MKKGLKSLLFIMTVVTVLCSLAIFSGAAQDGELKVPYVAAKNSADGVFIKWTKDNDAELYRIYRTNGEKTEKVAEIPSDTNLYTDTTAVSGSSYTYSVVPCVGVTEGKCLLPYSLTYIAQPKNIKAANTTDGVKITWTKSEGATKYNIYRKTPADTAWSHAGFVGNTNTFTDKAVTSPGEYIYTVRARNSAAVSSYDENGIGVKFIKAPELTSIKSVANGLYIKWSAVPGAQQYIIYRRAAGKTWSKLLSVKSGVTSYIDKTAEKNVTYAYTVRAVGSGAISYFYSGLAYRYIPVVKVSSVSNSVNGLTVKWAASVYATGYKIYRKADGEAGWTRVATVKGKNTVTFTDKKVTNNKNYTYTVIVITGNYQSTFDSTGKSGKFVSVPADIKVSKASGKNVITWTKISGGTYYYIYRRNEGTSAWTLLARVGNTNKYTDTTAKTATKYEYSLRAGIVNSTSKAYSAYSNPVKSSGIDPNGKMIALTYDDGPSNTVTNRILDVLEKYDAKATFFVLGSRIGSNYQPMVRAYNMGCEIANHSYSHIDFPSYSDATVLAEIDDTNELVRQYTGAYPKLLRTPGGSYNTRICNLIDLPIILWSIDTRDWEHRTASTTVSTIKSEVYDGAIILMHDIYDATASASESIIPWLVSQGYQLVTVSELMQYRSVSLYAGGVYTEA